MKKIYTLFVFFFTLNCTLFATQNPGFIITKDAKIITGKVADIFYSNWKTELVFINEMGRRYNFPPALIKGFAINTGSEIVEFESKFQKGQWRFLKILEKGKNLTLYRSPSVKTQRLAQNYSNQQIIKKNVREYWLEVQKDNPIRIYPISYKKQLRMFLANQPTLLDKLGQKGYKFRDLQKIIIEYNDLIERKLTAI
ncbi:MAG: hypothetical protein ACI9XO_002021 [Paraglaciecola sp.]|jgi:hypothetical protein